MARRRLILQGVSVASLIVLVIIGSETFGVVRSEPAGEVRSSSFPSYTSQSNRPIYSKPSPRPKPAVKLPQQLKEQVNPVPSPSLGDVERITQTVYGFLDFVTTIGNTVMVFTPQTKEVEAVNAAVQPSVSPTSSYAVVVSPTETVASREEYDAVEEREEVVPLAPKLRQPKLLQFPQVEIESSEIEPQVLAPQVVFAQSEEKPKNKKHAFIAATPVIPEAHIRSQVNVVASAPNLGSGEFIEDEGPSNGGGPVSSEQGNEEEDQEIPSPPANKKSAATTTTTAPTTSPPAKGKFGFTLKLTPKHNFPVLVTPTSTMPVVVTAQKVDLPPPPPKPVSLEPTGVLNQIYETKVDAAGKTTVIETKIIGTYIGTQYARVLESTSSVLANVKPTASSASASFVLPTKAALAFPSLPKPGLHKPKHVTILAQKAPTTTTTTPKTSTEHQHDGSENQDHPEDEQFDEEGQQKQEEEGSASAPLLEPTPTASEEQTHYVLPQKVVPVENNKKPEKIYVSAVPNPNAYSRQPQLYVDINPAKSVDVIVTATPTRGKQFRLSSSSNRFANSRTSKSPSGSDSNELTLPQEYDDAYSASIRPTSPSPRSGSRFGRNNGNRGRSSTKNEEPSTTVASASPSRRFKSGRGGSTSPTTPSSAPLRGKDYKTARGFSPSSRQQKNNNYEAILPTTSTSIYRFKLNRPTGRWRFKPSPKPKVNIIKTKEEGDETVEAGSDANIKEAPEGQVYLQYPEGAELQHPEETRTESNELAQDIEPELVPQTIRVATLVPTELAELEKYLEIATIKYITVTKTFTKDVIQPTLASSVAEATLENILATKPPYERILEGSSDVATLPVIALAGDVATPPLETITQSFSTTQLMLKTSILPVLYEGVTTLYTLTQSYFITRLVTAHKTVPPLELFQFVPTKSLNEFNTALQEAGSEHRDHLLGSESDDELETNYEHIIAPPDELTLVGSDFDPSFMDEKIPKRPRASNKEKEAAVTPRGKSPVDTVPPPFQQQQQPNPFATPNLNSIQDPLAAVSGLTPEQLAFIRYFTAQNQQQQHQQQIHSPQPTQPQIQLAPQVPQGFPPLPLPAPQVQDGQVAFTSSPFVFDTTATVTETKTLRLLFGAKPTHTVVYSTRVVPTRMTTYITASLPVKPTQAIAQNPFLNALPFPLAYVG